MEFRGKKRKGGERKGGKEVEVFFFERSSLKGRRRPPALSSLSRASSLDLIAPPRPPHPHAHCLQLALPGAEPCRGPLLKQRERAKEAAKRARIGRFPSLSFFLLFLVARRRASWEKREQKVKNAGSPPRPRLRRFSLFCNCRRLMLVTSDPNRP